MKLVRTILVIAISIAVAGTASARGMSHEVVDPGAVDIEPIYKTQSLEMAQPLQVEFFERAPATDFGFHPTDMGVAMKSLYWNAFPEPPQMDELGKNPSEAVRQPPQCDGCMKNPSEAVKQPPQCDTCMKNPSEAVKQPPQCDGCMKNPSEAVKQPLQCDTMCEKNPSEAVKQPPQCDTMCEKNPTQAVREPLDIECCGPVMSFRLKEDAHAEIAIYNVNGRLVRRISEMLSSGESSLTWDGMDDRGSRAASGVYFARVQANEEAGKGKLVLVR